MYSFYDLALFLLIYSFLGWAAEAGWYAVTRRKFCNRGVVALPLVLAYHVIIYRTFRGRVNSEDLTHY